MKYTGLTQLGGCRPGACEGRDCSRASVAPHSRTGGAAIPNSIMLFQRGSRGVAPRPSRGASPHAPKIEHVL